MFQRSEANWQKAKDELDTEVWLKDVKVLGEQDKYIGAHVEWQGAVSDVAITYSFDPSVDAGKWKENTVVIDVGTLPDIGTKVRAVKEHVSDEEAELLSVGQRVKISGVIVEREDLPVWGTTNMYFAKTATISPE